MPVLTSSTKEHMRCTAGDALSRWLSEVLQAERMELERRHEMLISEFALQCLHGGGDLRACAARSAASAPVAHPAPPEVQILGAIAVGLDDTASTVEQEEDGAMEPHTGVVSESWSGAIELEEAETVFGSPRSPKHSFPQEKVDVLSRALGEDFFCNDVGTVDVLKVALGSETTKDIRTVKLPPRLMSSALATSLGRVGGLVASATRSLNRGSGHSEEAPWKGGHEKTQAASSTWANFAKTSTPSHKQHADFCAGRQRRQSETRLKRIDAAFTQVVIAYLAFAAMETQVTGHAYGSKLGLRRGSTHDTFMLTLFEVVDLLFGAAFTIEAVLKLAIQRNHFFVDHWNCWDITIALSWLVISILVAAMPSGKHVLWLVPVVRLVCLMRFTRLIRKVLAMDSLYVFVTSIRRSFSALGWTFLLVIILETLFSLFIHTLLEPYLTDENTAMDTRLEIYRLFGTYERGMVTMFQAAFGYWTYLLFFFGEKVTYWLVYVIVAHQLLIGFAVVNIVSAVFMHAAFKAMEEGAAVKHKHSLRLLCESYLLKDERGRQWLSRERFLKAMADSDIATRLWDLGLDSGDLELMFALMDTDKDGHLALEDFLTGVGKLRGEARCIDLKALLALSILDSGLSLGEALRRQSKRRGAGPSASRSRRTQFSEESA